MQYLFLYATAEDAEPYVPEEDRILDWIAETAASGANRGGNRLRPPEDATTVRLRAGETLVTDGPYIESKEWIAGYDLIEADDLDAAIAIALGHPMARFGKVEIRPIWPFEEAGS